MNRAKLSRGTTRVMEYLKSSDVLIYLADATNQLLKNRGNYPTKASALSFYEEYFR